MVLLGDPKGHFVHGCSWQILADPVLESPLKHFKMFRNFTGFCAIDSLHIRNLNAHSKICDNFLATESSLKMMKNAFFHLKSPFCSQDI